MAHRGVAMLSGHGVGPLLYRWSGYLDGGTTLAADEMMMMGSPTFAISSFTVVSNQAIDLAGFSESLQRPVNRCQANWFTAMTKDVM
jgi:hypothetical protein